MNIFEIFFDNIFDFLTIKEYSCNLSNRNLRSLRETRVPLRVENFDVSKNKLKSLEYSPVEVDYYFCYDNQLETLEGMPKKVKGVVCSKNPLKTLKGGPEEAKEFFCCNTDIKNLYGIPKGVEVLDISNNPNLKNLRGCPKSVKKLIVHNTGIESLDGIPEELNILVLTCNKNLKKIKFLPRVYSYFEFGRNYIDLSFIYDRDLFHKLAKELVFFDGSIMKKEIISIEDDYTDFLYELARKYTKTELKCSIMIYPYYCIENYIYKYTKKYYDDIIHLFAVYKDENFIKLYREDFRSYVADMLFYGDVLKYLNTKADFCKDRYENAIESSKRVRTENPLYFEIDKLNSGYYKDKIKFYDV